MFSIHKKSLSPSSFVSKAFDLCSRAYCGIFDCLDEKIGCVRTDILKSSSCAVSAGIGISLSGRVIGINFALLTGWQTACAFLCGYSVLGISYVVHQYVTEALCSRGTQQILEKNAQNACGKKTAVVVRVPPLGVWDHLKNIQGHEFVLRRNIRQTSSGFCVQLLTVRSLEEWSRALDAIPDASIAHLQINAHGEPNAVILENNKDALIYYGEHLYDEGNRKKIQETDPSNFLLNQLDASLALMKKIGAKLAKDAVIILNACSTGRGANSLQKGFEIHCPQARVYAPTVDVRNMYLKDDFTPLFV